MRPPSLSAFALRLATVLCLAGGLLHATGLDDAQNATVFVKVSRGRVPFGTGSGFVVRVDDSGLYIVTNNHVVTEDEKSHRGLRYVGVLYSGTPREQSFSMELLSRNSFIDLALLKAKPIKHPPRPLFLSQAMPVKAKQKAYVIGFPLGEGLDLEGKNPVLTLSHATAKSNSNGRYGASYRIRMTGGAIPGNSGGPVVDPRGRLVGVLVEVLPGTHEIFIIPAEHVRDLWNGVRFANEIRVRSGYGLTVHMEIEVGSSDPFGNVEEAWLVALPIDGKEKTNLQGFHEQAAKYFRYALPQPSAEPGAVTVVPATFAIPDVGRGYLSFALQVKRRGKPLWLGMPLRYPMRGLIEPKPLLVDLAKAAAYLADMGKDAAPKDAYNPDREYAFTQKKLGGTLLTACDIKSPLRLTHANLHLRPACRPLWGDGGRTAYVLDVAGWLVKIALPSFERTAACRITRTRPLGLRANDYQRALTANIPTDLARSRDHLLVLSQALGPEIAESGLPPATESWVQVIDPATFRTRAIHALPGAVGLSACPDSDRVIVRYFNGEVGLLGPASGDVRVICRAARSVGLPEPGKPAPTVLPVQALQDAVLVSPGNRLLVRADQKVFLVQLRDDGTALPPGRQTKTWKHCSAIRYEPGAPTVLLLPGTSGGHRGKPPRPRLVSLRDLRTIDLSAANSTLCVDLRGKISLELPGNVPGPKFKHRSLRDGKARTHKWSFAKGREINLYRRSSQEPLVAHPRGNCFWMEFGGQIFWIEFGSTWVKPNRRQAMRRRTTTPAAPGLPPCHPTPRAALGRPRRHAPLPDDEPPPSTVPRGLLS